MWRYSARAIIFILISKDTTPFARHCALNILNFETQTFVKCGLKHSERQHFSFAVAFFYDRREMMIKKALEFLYTHKWNYSDQIKNSHHRFTGVYKKWEWDGVTWFRQQQQKNGCRYLDKIIAFCCITMPLKSLTLI